jgi:hypothetical protein
VSFDLAPWAAIEGEANFFPSDDLLLVPSSLTPTLRVATSGGGRTRVELSDTPSRHRSVAPPCWGGQCTSHNLSTRLGVGLRF